MGFNPRIPYTPADHFKFNFRSAYINRRPEGPADLTNEDIGRIGERIVAEWLTLRLTANIHWENATRERGLSYDISMTWSDGSVVRCEVKTTRLGRVGGDSFEFTQNEEEQSNISGEAFSIARLFLSLERDTFRTFPSIIFYNNVKRLCEHGALVWNGHFMNADMSKICLKESA